MKERLLKFLEEESLTAAKFADDIGVQRSSISHILSGRNNPGYDFIQKMLKRYPQINPEWLIMGNGKMTKTPQQASLFSIEGPLNDVNDEKSLPSQGNISAKASNGQISTEDSTIKMSSEINERSVFKKIEKVVILYSDQTFLEYVPSK